jgi:hypothetical protein
MSNAVGIAPLGQFIAPRGVELRAAQTVGILGGKSFRHRAVRPFEAAARRDPDRTLAARRGEQQPGRSLDHHLAHVVLAFADQRDVAEALRRIRRVAMHQRAHPFGAEPRLAGAASAER